MGEVTYLREEDARRASLADHLDEMAGLVRTGEINHVTAVYLKKDGTVRFTREGYIGHGDEIIRIIGTCHYHINKLLKTFESFTTLENDDDEEETEDGSGEECPPEPDGHEPEEA